MDAATEGVAKQMVKNQNTSSDKFLQSQPLIKTEKQCDSRKLHELPYHFLKAKMMDELKTHCLCNYEFILAKLRVSSLADVFEDLQMALSVNPADPDLRLLSDSLFLSHDVLEEEPGQLATQLVGRLEDIVATDRPVAPRDPLKYPFLHPLLRDAKRSSTPALIPSSTCLTPPEGVLFNLLSGHTAPITALTTTSDGHKAITTSMDNTMKIWDLRKAEIINSIEEVGKDVFALKMAWNNRYIVTGEDGCFRIWQMARGTFVHRINTFESISRMTTAEDGNLLVAFFDASMRMRCWDIKNDFKLLREVHIEEDEVSGNDNQPIIVANNAFGHQVLFAYKGSSKATSINVRSGRIIRDFQTRNQSSSILALAYSRGYFILCCRYMYMELHKINVLELFDAQNGVFLRTVKGCRNDNVDELLINTVGSHAMNINISPSTHTSDITVWNIETGEHMHMCRQMYCACAAACRDFRFFLTAEQNGCALRVWDISAKVNNKSPSKKMMDTVDTIVPLAKDSQYVYTQSNHNGTVHIWNILKNGSKAKAVRSEHHLSEKGDVVLLRGTNILILSKKDFSLAHDDGRLVFHKLSVYDTKQRNYVSNISECSIVPAQSHEYKYLADNILLGLSENRTHFVLWDTQTGLAKKRLSPTLNKEKDHNENENTQRDGLHAISEETEGRIAGMVQKWKEVATATLKRNRNDEKYGIIEQFLLSVNEKVLVCSYHSYHICIFNLELLQHVHTLESQNALMLLHVAVLSFDGSLLTHSSYDDNSKTSYVTMWDTVSGDVHRKLDNEQDVHAIATTDNGERTVFTKGVRDIVIVDSGLPNCRRIVGYRNMNLREDTKIYMIDNGKRAAVWCEDISLWDLENESVLGIFHPDMPIQCLAPAMNGRLLVFGFSSRSGIITLRLGSDEKQEASQPANLFEEDDSSSDEWDSDYDT